MCYVLIQVLPVLKANFNILRVQDADVMTQVNSLVWPNYAQFITKVEEAKGGFRSLLQLSSTELAFLPVQIRGRLLAVLYCTSCQQSPRTISSSHGLLWCRYALDMSPAGAARRGC